MKTKTHFLRSSFTALIFMESSGVYEPVNIVQFPAIKSVSKTPLSILNNTNIFDI